jgi:uncharacterized membrane protein YccC
MPHTPTTGVLGTVTGVRGTIRRALRPARLILAGKTALAAGVAWFIGQLLPEVDQYSYYAPLGALIVMMPTLMGSLRSTAQMILGLGLGILLAWAVILSPMPGAVSVALAVGLGVVLAGISGLGTGSDYVPIAALFVLVVGGANPDEFSVGYLLQMGLGMLVGIVINIVVFPPLWRRESSRAISGLRRDLATILDDAAAAIEGPDFDPKASLRALDNLEHTVRATKPLVTEAAESRLLNVRAWRHPYDTEEDFGDLTALDRVADHVRTMIEDTRAVGRSDELPALSGSIREILARLGALVSAWDARRDGAAERAAVERAAAQFDKAIRAAGDATPALTRAMGVSLDAQRVAAVIAERLEAIRPASAGTLGP